MTAGGLAVTAIALALIVARELAQAGVGEQSADGQRRLGLAVAVACAAWAVLTVVQIVRYLV